MLDREPEHPRDFDRAVPKVLDASKRTEVGQSASAKGGTRKKMGNILHAITTGGTDIRGGPANPQRVRGQ